MNSFYKGKTILITGNTGFKGSWLSQILISLGANVIGYSLEAPTNPNLFSIIGLDKRMTTIIGDIRNFDLLKATIEKYQPEIVFHLAAQPIVLTSYQEPRYTYETNVMGTVNLLEAIRETNCVKSFLNVTTDKVYENNGNHPHSFKEDEKLDGFDPYSNSKSCSELVTHSYAKSFFADNKVAISTARAGNVIGGGDFSPNRIIPDCVRAAVENKTIEVRNKYSTRPYQFVLEPLFVYLLIAKKQYEDHKYCRSYNVGPDKKDAVTTGEITTRFCQYWGDNLSWEDHTIPGAPHEAGFLSLDNTLLKQTFGWKPICSIDEALKQTIEFSKAYYNDGLQKSLEVMENQIDSFETLFFKSNENALASK
jgi:CDP-glucose 4,6-dehydratase